MDLSKHDTKMTQGLAIIFMVLLHLFNRTDDLPYTALIYVAGKPIMYYIGLIGDCCVLMYAFCSGYAHYIMRNRSESGKRYYADILKKCLRFLINFWIVLILFSVLGLIFDGTGEIPGGIEKFAGNFFLYSLSYNGAWWYVLTYVFMVLLSPILYNITKKCGRGR